MWIVMFNRHGKMKSLIQSAVKNLAERLQKTDLLTEHKNAKSPMRGLSESSARDSEHFTDRHQQSEIQ